MALDERSSNPGVKIVVHDDELNNLVALKVPWKVYTDADEHLFVILSDWNYVRWR